MTNEDFHNKYRPDNLDDVIGQEAAVKSIRALFKLKNLPHSYMFYGPAGTGKTTLARIIAKHLDCEEENITEVDAGSKRGVNEMKELINSLIYGTFGDNPIKMIILDEVQALTTDAFNALLKTLETPPNHVYFVLCTTEYAKVPETIRSRCHQYHLKEVSYKDIYDLLVKVAKKEKIKLSEDSIKFVAKQANGCVRNGLMFLSQVRSCDSKDEVAKVLEAHLDDKEVIELCRLLGGDIKKFVWKDVQKILLSLRLKNPESVRIQVANYLTSCVLKAESIEKMMEFSRRLDLFSEPIYNKDAFYRVILNSVKILNGALHINEEL
jgi:DNA polymerase-3 subunit gamma/tau